MKIQLSDKESINISISALADEIYSHSQWLQSNFSEDEFQLNYASDGCQSDVRLRVHDGNWELLTGDLSFDTDHRGFWSYSSCPYRCTKKQSLEIARSLINNLE